MAFNKRHFAQVAFCALLSIGLSAFAEEKPVAPAAQAAADEKPVWQIWGGGLWRFGGKISASWYPERCRPRLPASYSRSKPVTGLPSEKGYANRTYVDGYVHMDEGTLNPGTEIYGTTWNWDYDNRSQFDGSTLAFKTGAYGSSDSFASVPASAASDEEDLDFPGLELGISRDFGEWLRGDVAIAGGFRYFFEDDAHFAHSAIVGREAHSVFTVVDVYDAHWPDVPGPGEGPNGTYEGPGYLLDCQPMYRETRPTGGSGSSWRVASATKASLEFFDFRLGPSIEWVLNDWSRLSLSAQVMLARASLDVDGVTEVYKGSRLASSQNFSESEDDWIWGASGSITLDFMLSDTWFLALSGSYDWYADDVKASVGPYDFTGELGEATISLCLGKDF